MNQTPAVFLPSEYLGDSQLLRSIFAAPNLCGETLNGHGHSEIGAYDRAHFLLGEAAGRELRSRPIEPGLNFAPSALEAAEPAQHGYVLAMGIQFLQRLGVALDHRGVGCLRQFHDLVPGFVSHELAPLRRRTR